MHHLVRDQQRRLWRAPLLALLLLAALTIAVNFLIDLGYLVLDPRLRAATS